MLRKKLKLDNIQHTNNSPEPASVTDESTSIPSFIPNSNTENNLSSHIASSFLQIENELSYNLNNWLTTLKSSKIHYVYNPLEYASDPHSKFIRQYCNSTKKIVFLGINPGPYGMCQTGIPFGEVEASRDWLQVTAQVKKPFKECPNRPIHGFDCTRSEVSGKRFWTLFKNISVSPQIFFKNCMVYNYCPLAFMASNGNNVTPQEIKVHHLFFKFIKQLVPNSSI